MEVPPLGGKTRREGLSELELRTVGRGSPSHLGAERRWGASGTPPTLLPGISSSELSLKAAGKGASHWVRPQGTEQGRERQRTVGGVGSEERSYDSLLSFVYLFTCLSPPRDWRDLDLRTVSDSPPTHTQGTQ